MSVVEHIEKGMEILRRGVSDRHDGYAGQIVEGMMVHHRCVYKRTLGKSWKPLGIGSLTTRTVVQDGPSRERWSVACARW